MIRRHKTTIFTDAKESTTVYELKRIVEGILKRPPEDQRLYKVSIGASDASDTYLSPVTQRTAWQYLLKYLLEMSDAMYPCSLKQFHTFFRAYGDFVTFSPIVPQDDQLLEDSKTLGDSGFTNQTARPQAPATVGLAFRINGMLSPCCVVCLLGSGLFLLIFSSIIKFYSC